jgi:hypothetical protein
MTMRLMRRVVILSLAALVFAAPAAAQRPKPRSFAKLARAHVVVARTAASLRTATGALTALDSSSLTVRTDGGDVTCTLGESSPRLGDFHVGDKVKIACSNEVLTAIAKLDGGDVRTESGTLVALSDMSVTVRMLNGELTCTLGDGSPTLGDFHVGDKVKVVCAHGVLTTIAKVLTDNVVSRQGTLTALSESSVTVHSGDGDLACSRGDRSAALGDFRVGDLVKVSCANGVLSAMAKVATSTVVTRLGTLTALSDASVTVHNGDGDLTCKRTDASPALGDFHVGDLVKMSCSNGVLTTIARVA